MSMSAALAAGITATSAAIGQAASINATNNLNRRNRQWQESMWNKTNAYNTPLAQKERLEEAGINPYAVLAQGGSDTGQSSMASPPQQFQPNFDATANAGSNILGAINMAKQNELLDQQKEQGRVNLEFIRMEKLAGMQKLYAEIGNLLEQKNLTHAEREMLERQHYILGESMNSIINGRFYESEQGRIRSENLQREFDDNHITALVKQAAIKAEIRLSNARCSQVSQEILESMSRIQYNASAAALNFEQVRTEIQKQASEITNRVVKREENKRAWNSLYMDVSKTMYDIWERGRTAKTAFGEWRPPLPGMTRDFMDSMHTPYAFPKDY